jgi:5-methylcytosine-specific restriction protein A
MARLATLKPRVRELETSRAPVVTSWRDDKRGSTQRGYTYRWQRESKRFLAQHPLCVDCEAEGQTGLATEVDHEVPHRGDAALFWDRGNWRPRCKPHHSAKTARGE